MKRSSLLHSLLDSTLLRGLVVGLVATEALDWVSIVLYDNESSWLRFRENRARHFKHAYEAAVDKMARAGGVSLSRREMQVWGWRFHKTFGVLGGLAYAALRKREPRVGAGLGLGFGAAFFLIADEILMPLQGLTPGPRAFSWKVHARGAAAHVAFGVAAETAYRLLDAASSATAPSSARLESATAEVALPSKMQTAPAAKSAFERTSG